MPEHYTTHDMTPTYQRLAEAVRHRTSVRSYAGTPVDRHAIDRAIAMNPIPWGNGIRITPAYGIRSGISSTYGVISGTDSYLVLTAGTSSSDTDIMAGAYAMERIILTATTLGLGTCWLGGTFSRHRFAESIPLAEDERIVCAVAIGQPAPHRRLLERAMRAAVRSARRRNAGELFFAGDFATPYPSDGPLCEALELVRLAPSAANRQPWRIVVDNKQSAAAHLYSMPDNGFGAVDMGIAMSHFDLLLPPAPWSFDDINAPAPPGLTFIASRPTAPAV